MTQKSLEAGVRLAALSSRSTACTSEAAHIASQSCLTRPSSHT